MTTERAHVYVSGMVQGVTFRATTRRRAEQRDVDGWVKNLDDGRVEAVFEGAPDDVDAMVDFCHRGPEFADVDEVEVAEEQPEGLDGFDIRR